MIASVLSRGSLATLTLFAQSETTYHRFARLESFTEGWQWLLLVAIVAGIAACVIWLYRRDTYELPRATAVSLLVLRLAALAGLLFYFLDLERGTERTLMLNSRAVLLLDVSQSMAQRDMADASGREQTRAEAVQAALERYRVIDRLRQHHDVSVLAIGDWEKPPVLASWPKHAAQTSAERRQDAEQRSMERLSIWTTRLGMLCYAAALVSAVMAVLSARVRRIVPGEAGSWSLLAATVLAISGTVLLATAHLASANLPGSRNVKASESDGQANTGDQDRQQSPAPGQQVDWRELLAPRAQETRLGDAVQYAVLQERGGPISGIIVISDGQSNAGTAPAAATAVAQEAGIPIHTIAVGSDRPPTNVRVVDVEAPPRVYPGDRFEIKGYLQAFHIQGRSVAVRLTSQAVDGDGSTTTEDEKTVVLGDDGATQPVTFDLEPPPVGKRRYILTVQPPAEDRNDADNSKSATVDVVDQRNRVLILAGGPSREYQFVRNLLYRDRDTTSLVLLQSGEPGISQEGDELLFDFPRTEEELFSIDCILAFDPDWLRLDEQQIRLLERWVSEEAGGLLVVAGPVYTAEWSRMRRGRDARVDLLKALYPVQFISEGASSMELGRLGGDEPWPLQFTRDGLNEKFLWLDDDPVRNEAAWASFPGVYGYFAVRDVKKGARVYAYFSDPREQSLDKQLPIYWAGHFYGAGRVFFAASGEMWRLRALDEAYFNRFYTKLIRWLSQGRLLRGSRRGMLLVDKERCFIGDHVVVNAVMTDAQRRPLDTPTLDVVLIAPDGSRQTLTLRRVEQSLRGGEYQEQFLARQEGDYRLELAPPGSVDELLTVDIHCSSSAAETRSVVRNDALLREMAQRTRGAAYQSLDQAFSDDTAQTSGNVFAGLPPQDQETRLPGTPDRDFKRRLSAWLMGLIAGALSLEWLIRRLNRLA